MSKINKSWLIFQLNSEQQLFTLSTKELIIQQFQSLSTKSQMSSSLMLSSPQNYFLHLQKSINKNYESILIMYLLELKF